MYPLLRALGCTNKDVALYVIGAMLDRVSVVMLAEASGFEFIHGEAFYREAGRLQYWNICMRTLGYDMEDERFACAEGAALGGFVDKMYEFVKSQNYRELFDRVEKSAPAHVWNSLFRKCGYLSEDRNFQRFYNRICSGAPITGIEFHGYIRDEDYRNLACGASRNGRGSEFVEWLAKNRMIEQDHQQIAVARSCIINDDVNMFRTLLPLMNKSARDVSIHALRDIKAICIREYLATL